MRFTVAPSALLNSWRFLTVSCVCSDKDLNLWIHALAFFASRENNPCDEQIREVLSNIERNQLLPPLLVIQILAQRKTATLSVVKDYIIDTLKAASHKISENNREIREISEETKRMRHETEMLRTRYV
jgi:vacuolar protein sorting-associated protein 11